MFSIQAVITPLLDTLRQIPIFSNLPSAVNQVWTNLIDNVIDPMDGQGQIWLRTSKVVSQPGGTRFQVRLPLRLS